MDESPAADDTLGVVDLTVIGQLHDDVGRDRGITADLVGSYAERAPDLLTALGDAVASADDGALRRTAHDLRSMSAFVGALEIVKLAAELEDDEWSSERSAELVAAISGLVPAAVRELRGFVEAL